MDPNLLRDVRKALESRRDELRKGVIAGTLAIDLLSEPPERVAGLLQALGLTEYAGYALGPAGAWLGRQDAELEAMEALIARFDASPV